MSIRIEITGGDPTAGRTDQDQTLIRDSGCVKSKRPVGTVVDLFCGAGALSHGFKLEGFSIACGYDIDEACRFPFERNNDAPFVRRDISKVHHEEIDKEFPKKLPRILIGCAPCQPFSKYSQGREDPKWHLLADFARLVVGVQPDVLTMENVPQLVRFKGGSVFNEFVRQLQEGGYWIKWMEANCPTFGVPQDRSRLVLIGSKFGEPNLPIPTHKADEYLTVSDAIGDMPHLVAGQTDPDDCLHRSSRMSELNFERIRASRPGGTWKEWHTDLVASCHKKHTGRGYISVYGRMQWDQPAPTITTQFYGFGNGRFGHPEQNRALSLREGAILQTFPRNYAFVEPCKPVQFKRIGRMIGNAVPVRLAQAIARAVKTHLQEQVH